MNFRGRVIFLFLVLATGFSGGFLAQLWFSPAPAIAGGNRSLTANMIYVMGPDGKQRIQLGSYVQPHEKGLPLIAFMDNGQKLRLLFRLAGKNQSPVLIFKDKKGRDRIVLGLGLRDSGEEPFLAIYDEDMDKDMVFGKYP